MSKGRSSLPGWSALALLFALAVFALAGCGGGGGGSTSANAGSTSTSEEEAGGKSSGGESSESEGSTPSEPKGSEEGGGKPSAEGEGGGKAGGEGGATKAEFLASADAICKEAQVKVSKELKGYLSGEPSASAHSPEEGPEAITEEVVIPAVEEEMASIQELDTPAEASAASEAIVGGFEGIIAEAEEDPEGFLVKSTAVTKAKKTGEAHGFKSCGAV